MIEKHSCGVYRLYFRLLMLFFFFSCVQSAHAAIECFFTVHGQIDINYENYSVPITLHPGGGWYSTPFITSESRDTSCNTGRTGDDLNGWASLTPAMTVTSPNGKYQVALYRTNLQGLYYTIEVKSSTTPPYGYLPSSKSFIELYDVSDDDEKNYLKGVHHDFYITLYQGNDYVPGASEVHPLDSGILGQFQYGSRGGEEVKVNVVHFSIPLTVPTCSASLSQQNASGNTVHLGQNSVDDIQNNRTKPIPFSFSFSNCSNAAKVTATVKSTLVDMETGYVKNMGEDMGVGVKLVDSGNHQLIPNNNATSMQINGSSATMSLTAQLLKTNSTNIQSGAFKANTTFEFTYN
ncbi:fimbrial protein [Citrobacter arsenatis]|uniref:fimbrial protein n=1 Tax=Citrobacter arsenatis TaxID=2546350 RepID=UPI00300E4014